MRTKILPFIVCFVLISTWVLFNSESVIQNSVVKKEVEIDLAIPKDTLGAIGDVWQSIWSTKRDYLRNKASRKTYPSHVYRYEINKLQRQIVTYPQQEFAVGQRVWVALERRGDRHTAYRVSEELEAWPSLRGEIVEIDETTIRLAYGFEESSIEIMRPRPRTKTKEDWRSVVGPHKFKINTEGRAKILDEDPYIAFFRERLPDFDLCFLMRDITNNIEIASFGGDICNRREPPCSTFKLPLSLMAFDSGYFQTIDQTIPWDGTRYDREALNQDQSPRSFLENSVLWVSKEIMKQFDADRVTSYLQRFKYGNMLVPARGKVNWLPGGGLEISPVEQMSFLESLWRNNFGLVAGIEKFMQQVMLVESVRERLVYGKTGSGCLDGSCDVKGEPQIGWFVGLVNHKRTTYTFVLMAKQRKQESPQSSWHMPAGLKARGIMLEFFDTYYY